MSLRLRRLVDADLDSVFEWERNSLAVQLAAFTRDDPSNRDAFDAYYPNVRNDASNVLLAVELNGRLSAQSPASPSMATARFRTGSIRRVGARASLRLRLLRSSPSRRRDRSLLASPSTTSVRQRCSIEPGSYA